MACNVVLNFSKNVLMMDLFLTNKQPLASQGLDGLEWFGLLWCFYHLFGLSFRRHPFTAEHPLVSKWCNTTFLSKSVPMKNNPISLVYLVNYCFKTIFQFKVKMTSNPTLKLGILGYKLLAYFAFLLSYAFSFICIYKLKINKLNQLVLLTVHCSSETSQDHLKKSTCSCVAQG